MTLEEASIKAIAEQLALKNNTIGTTLYDYWAEAKAIWQEDVGVTLTDEEYQDKYPISQKNELILDVSKDNEVLEANEVTNNTDTEAVNTAGENDDEDATDWSMFMAHINESEWDEVEKEVQKLNADYIIAFEKTPYDHFHFLVKITPDKYHSFSKRVFIDKYKLRGQVGRKGTKDEGKIKQYGKMRKEIKSLKKIMSYTLKEQSFRTNMTVKSIEKILCKKIEECKNTKQDDLLIRDKCLKYVEEHYKPEIQHHKYMYDNIPDELAWTTFIEPEHCIRAIIIQFMLNEKMFIRKTTIESYYYHIISYSSTLKLKKNSMEIYKQLYHREING